MRRKFDRVLALGGVVAIASVALLSAGLFTIFSALAEDHVDLPSEGTLEQILQDTAGGSADSSAVGAPDVGVSPEDIGPAEASPAAVAADPPEPATTPSPKPLPSPIPTATPPPPPPPPAPVALAIPRVEAAAPVVALGLDADRYPEVPDGRTRSPGTASPLPRARPATPSSPPITIGWMSSVRGRKASSTA